MEQYGKANWWHSRLCIQILGPKGFERKTCSMHGRQTILSESEYTYQGIIHLLFVMIKNRSRLVILQNEEKAAKLINFTIKVKWLIRDANALDELM